MNGDDRRAKIDELDITREELDTFGEALKSAEFRKLLCEYVDEINDPENRARNEREIELYERERGAQVTFVRPRPGYVLKTSGDGVRKVFVNVCSSDAVQKPSSRADAAGGGDHWSLPHCLSPVRQDYDKAHKPCDVYDVVFHPDALLLAKSGHRLRRMVEDTALQMVERNNGVSLDRANVKYPNIPFKGLARSLVIRNPIRDYQPPSDGQDAAELPGCPYQPPVQRPVQHHDLGPLKQNTSPPFTVPKYTIKYRSDVDIQEHAYNMHCKMNAVIPKELIVEINLPLLDSSVNVELDVLPKSLKMVCNKPSKYKLDVNLPYKVLEDEGNATFDQSTKKLIVRLPVLRTEPQLEYVKNLVCEVEMSKDEMCADNLDGNDVNGHLNVDQNNDHKQESVTMNGNEVIVANHLHNENTNDLYNNTESNNNCNGSANDVHYIVPEHEFIFGNKCILMLNVKNVDPTSVNVIVVNDKNLISGKFHSIGSGFFPIWFAFCIQIPSKSSLLKSDVKILPSDEKLILEFSLNLIPDCKQYKFGRDQDNFTTHNINMETLKENMNAIANGVSVALNDSDDDCDDEDVFDDSKEEIGSKVAEYQNTKKNNENFRCKDKNGKTTKGKRKKGKKIQKSNAIPIIATGSLPESEKKMDFMPGSLPIEFNNIRPAIVSVYVIDNILFILCFSLHFHKFIY